MFANTAFDRSFQLWFQMHVSLVMDQASSVGYVYVDMDVIQTSERNAGGWADISRHTVRQCHVHGPSFT
jgi:hypothetical protein